MIDENGLTVLSMSGEQWRATHVDDQYKVSSKGRVRSEIREEWRILKATGGKVTINGKGITVAHLVHNAFIGKVSRNKHLVLDVVLNDRAVRNPSRVKKEKTKRAEGYSSRPRTQPAGVKRKRSCKRR